MCRLLAPEDETQRVCASDCLERAGSLKPHTWRGTRGRTPRRHAPYGVLVRILERNTAMVALRLAELDIRNDAVILASASLHLLEERDAACGIVRAWVDGRCEGVLTAGVCGAGGGETARGGRDGTDHTPGTVWVGGRGLEAAVLNYGCGARAGFERRAGDGGDERGGEGEKVVQMHIVRSGLALSGGEGEDCEYLCEMELSAEMKLALMCRPEDGIDRLLYTYSPYVPEPETG